MRISTFHSLGLAILREQHEYVGLKRGFGVCDAQFRRKICAELLEGSESPIRNDPELCDLEVADLVRRISSVKTSGADVAALLRSEDLYQRQVGQTLATYNARLRELQLVDLDDMVGLPVQILEGNPTLRRWYQQRYRHVLIDRRFPHGEIN